MSHMLAIITVVYKNYTVLDEFLESFLSQKNNQFHIFIADLSPEKKSFDTKGLPVTILPGENKGYSYGVNLGIEEALKEGYDSFCIMNNDTYVSTTFVENIVSSMKEHPGSIITGKIYYAAGFEYYGDKYSKAEKGKVFWYGGGKMDPAHALITHRGVDQVDHGQYDTFSETGFVSGCLMCYDKSVYEKVGKWDESYFLYYEDADFCERAKHKHIPLYFNPSIVMWHKNAQSTEGSGSSIHEKYLSRNQVKFALKYTPLRTKFHVVKNYFLRK